MIIHCNNNKNSFFNKITREIVAKLSVSSGTIKNPVKFEGFRWHCPRYCLFYTARILLNPLLEFTNPPATITELNTRHDVQRWACRSVRLFRI